MKGVVALLSAWEAHPEAFKKSQQSSNPQHHQDEENKQEKSTLTPDVIKQSTINANTQPIQLSIQSKVLVDEIEFAIGDLIEYKCEFQIQKQKWVVAHVQFVEKTGIVVAKSPKLLLIQAHLNEYQKKEKCQAEYFSFEANHVADSVILQPNDQVVFVPGVRKAKYRTATHIQRTLVAPTLPLETKQPPKERPQKAGNPNNNTNKSRIARGPDHTVGFSTGRGKPIHHKSASKSMPMVNMDNTPNLSSANVFDALRDDIDQ